MPEVEFTNLLIVAVIALIAPLTLGFAPSVRVPAVVLEILAGVVVGPHGLGWVEIDLPIQIVSLIGLAFLLFLAGLEVDVHQLRGPLLRLAIVGFIVTLVLGMLVGLGLHAADWVMSPTLIAVTLAATSLGLVVPVLKDAGQIESPLGQSTIAAASIADFGAIVLLSLFFSTSGGSTGSRLVLLIAFAALVAVTALVVSLVARSKRLDMTLTRLQDTTAEIRVRAAVVLLIAFVALAEKFGLESILGAFMAGAVVGILDRDTESHPNFHLKLEAMGYGFLIPVFFVASGMRLDLGGLFGSPSAIARVPVFVLALLVVRGVPALLFARTFDRSSVAAAALLQATSLPFIVTATQIGVLAGLMTPVTAAALICAGLVSVIVFPTVALSLLRSRAITHSTRAVT
ncbi:MAG TPA: cation:proton antiporter [Nocardioidaceae bacterium]|nr:cation:proton antiporter [Nocardioidaceae bacterium]